MGHYVYTLFKYNFVTTWFYYLFSIYFWFLSLQFSYVLIYIVILISVQYLICVVHAEYVDFSAKMFTKCYTEVPKIHLWIIINLKKYNWPNRLQNKLLLIDALIQYGFNAWKNSCKKFPISLFSISCSTFCTFSTVPISIFWNQKI